MPALIASAHPIVSCCHPIMVKARFWAAAAVMVVRDIHPVRETIVTVLVMLDVV